MKPVVAWFSDANVHSEAGKLTGMRRRKAVRVAIRLVYREALSALHALQLDEAPERDAGRARREAEHLRPLLPVERLERAPEPNDDRV